MDRSMKLFLMPHAPSWWAWAATASLLASGVVGQPDAFLAATALSAAQTVFFAVRERDFAAYPVQIRVAYTALLAVAFVPGLQWLYWLPMAGTYALVFFGYCLMARVLSLMPWNRREPLTLDLLRRTLLTPPVAGNASHGLPAAGCPGGICTLEAHAAEFATANTSHTTL
jgi:hypothetical protein